METPVLPQAPSLLDLSGVDEDRRAGVWALEASSVFPGLSVNDMPAEVQVGQIRSVPMGGGSLWSVLSAPVQVSYAPANGAARHPEEHDLVAALALQVEGEPLVDDAHVAGVEMACAPALAHFHGAEELHHQ